MLSLVVRAITNRPLLDAYRRGKTVPVLGWVLRLAARVLVPLRRTRWASVQGGVARDLDLLTYARYELSYLRGEHEPFLQDLLCSWLQPGEIFFDVGAHIGFFTLIACRLIGARGSVLAFEPDPENFARLKANVSRNGVSWAKVLNVAVWSKPGKVAFARSPSLSSGMEGMVLREEEMRKDSIALDCVTLDEFFDPRPGVVKIDVEGGEVMVLEGARRLLAGGKLRWVVEVHNQINELAVVSLLEEMRYKCMAFSAQRGRGDSNSEGRYVTAVRQTVD